MFKVSIEKKNKGVYCCAYSCTEKPVEKKGGLCHKHYERKRRFLDPVGVRYGNFKSKSKARNIENTITLKEFRAFCERTGYIITKYKRGRNATIDRLCNVHGYHIWNIGLKTNFQNARKGAKHSENFECPF